MDQSELNTEQIILEAAEAEFLEKGYGNAKMMAIAKRAHVSHSMLHYYFRSKENLFQTIFLQKAHTLFPLFEDIFERRLPFFETIRLLMETQFNFIMQNPKLPFFILTEILSNQENRAVLFEILSSKATHILTRFKKAMEREIRKGTIRPMRLQDLMMNIIAINLSLFLALPVLQDMLWINDENMEHVLNKRRENNVQFILNALKPDASNQNQLLFNL